MRTVAAVVALVVCVHAGLWTLLQRQQAVANIDAPLASISYSPYTRSQHPDYGDRPTAEQIRADLKILSILPIDLPCKMDAFGIIRQQDHLLSLQQQIQLPLFVPN